MDTPFSPALATSWNPTRLLISVSSLPGTRCSTAALNWRPVSTPARRSVDAPALPSSDTRIALRTSSVPMS